MLVSIIVLPLLVLLTLNTSYLILLLEVFNKLVLDWFKINLCVVVALLVVGKLE